MARGMEITLRLAGLQQASAGLRQYAQDAQAAQGAAKTLQDVQLKPPTVRGKPFLSGPEQKLLKIQEQRQRLPEVENPLERAAIGKDLDRSEFLAKRSIVLHQRRMENPEESLNRPGLLELFSDLNSLLKGIVSSRGAVDVLRNVGLGVKLLSAPGGLNIQQKVARAGINPAPVVGAAAAQAVTQVTGKFNAAALAAGHAGIARQLQQGAPPRVAAQAAQATQGLAVATADTTGAMEGLLSVVSAAPVPVKVALAGFIAGALAVKVLADAAVQAAQSLNSVGVAAMQSGGSAGDIARLKGLGINPEQAGSTAGNLRQRISSDPFARATAARFGISAIPRELRGMNEARLLEKAIDGLRNSYKRNIPIIGEERAALEQLRQAQVLDLESVIALARGSDRLWKAQKRDAKVLEGIYDADSVKIAAELNAEMDRTKVLSEAWQVALGKPVLRDATNALHGFNDALRSVAAGANSLQKWGDRSVNPRTDPNNNLTPWKMFRRLALEFAANRIMPGGGAVGGWINDWLNKQEQAEKKKAKPGDRETEAQRKLREAIEALTAALPTGTHGGGPGAQSAIPSDLRGPMLDAAIAGNTLRQGGYRL